MKGASSTNDPSAGSKRKAMGASLLLIALTVIVYLPALSCGFVWDDDTILTKNALIRAPDGLYRLWFTREPIDYWPVTYSSFWLEWRLWGLHAVGYHAVNIGLHALSSVLLYWILRLLRVPGALLAAALFAIHPVNVESVAWVAERKNTLSLFLLLFCALAYFKSEENRGKVIWYALSLAGFLFAMLAKGSVALVPFTFIVLILWRRTFTWKDAQKLSPFFVVSVVLTWVNIWFQTHGSGEVIRNASLVERILGAGAVVWFYLWKAIFPVNLCFVYPQWIISVAQPAWWLPLLAAVAVTILLFSYRKSGCAPYLVAWISFCAALVPVMGMKDVYFMKYSLVADHYQYLALISIVAMAAAGWERWRVHQPIPATIAAFLVVCLLGSETSMLARTYRDSTSLFEETVARNPRAWMAHNNLAYELRNRGQNAEAITHLKIALDLHPDYPEAEINLGNAFSSLGKIPDATLHYGKALQMDPNAYEAYIGLGNNRMVEGKAAEALHAYNEALLRKPNSFEVHNNIANALRLAGRPTEAIAEFKKSLELEPENAQALLDLGRALLSANSPSEAVPWFRESLSRRPGSLEAHNALANALNAMGKPEEAVAEYNRALELKADYVDAHYNLALTLLRQGKIAEARPHYAEAIRLNPNLRRQPALE